MVIKNEKEFWLEALKRNLNITSMVKITKYQQMGAGFSYMFVMFVSTVQKTKTSIKIVHCKQNISNQTLSTIYLFLSFIPYVEFSCSKGQESNGTPNKDKLHVYFLDFINIICVPVVFLLLSYGAVVDQTQP